jgi:hypothetical protein
MHGTASIKSKIYPVYTVREKASMVLRRRWEFGIWGSGSGGGLPHCQQLKVR